MIFEEKEIEVIKKMLLNKLDYEVISNVTGKTIDQLNKCSKISKYT